MKFDPFASKLAAPLHSKGLAECSLPIPRKLAPLPGKRSPPPPESPTATPKKSPKKLEPREVRSRLDVERYMCAPNRGDERLLLTM